MLAHFALGLLREYWGYERPTEWLFRADRSGRCRPAVQRVFQRALTQAGIAKPACVHTLRHCFAIHLVGEWGGSISHPEDAGAWACQYHGHLSACDASGVSDLVSPMDHWRGLSRLPYRAVGGDESLGGSGGCFPCLRGPIERYLGQLSLEQLRAMRAIEVCRTAELGAMSISATAVVRSDLHNSCRNRHCPKCQGLDKERWREARRRRSYRCPIFTWCLPYRRGWVLWRCATKRWSMRCCFGRPRDPAGVER